MQASQPLPRPILFGTKCSECLMTCWQPYAPSPWLCHEDEVRQKVIITYFCSIVIMSCDSGPDPSTRVSHNNHGHSVKSSLPCWSHAKTCGLPLCAQQILLHSKPAMYDPRSICQFNKVKTTGFIAFPAFEKPEDHHRSSYRRSNSDIASRAFSA